MEYACVESMTRLVVGLYRVRVWREERGVQNSYPETYQQIAAALPDVPNPINAPAIIAAICRLGRINAVEVLNEEGDGVVCYPTWP